jgi:hypothetical protein
LRENTNAETKQEVSVFFRPYFVRACGIMAQNFCLGTYLQPIKSVTKKLSRGALGQGFL